MSLGSTFDSRLVCIVEHVNHRLAPVPSIVWVQNGIQVNDTDSRITVTNMETAEYGHLESTLRIDNFQFSDIGVYQCISTDDMAFSGEIITSTPYQLDAGMVENFRRVFFFGLIPKPPPQFFLSLALLKAYSRLELKA